MIPQLWNAITKIKQKAEEKGWLTRWRVSSSTRALLDVVDDKGRFYRVDALEQTGRVYSEQALKRLSPEQWVLRALEQPKPIRWQELKEYLTHLEEEIKKYPTAVSGESYLILLTAGLVPVDTISDLLKEPERKPVSLMLLTVEKESGKVKAKSFSHLKSALFDMAQQMLEEEEVRIETTVCKHCGQVPVVACHQCLIPLCKSHFMPCPLCKLPFCHPDVNNCYFQHKC